MLFANDATLWVKQHVPINWLWKGLCLFFIFAIMWNVVSVFSTEPPIQSIDVPSTEPLRLKKIQMVKHLEAPLFGVYVPQGADIAASKLSYVVVGIMYAKDERYSQVVLRNEVGFDVIYHQNEFLKSGVQLKSIQPDGVIILNQGRLERLSLPKNDLRFDPPPAPLLMKE